MSREGIRRNQQLARSSASAVKTGPAAQRSRLQSWHRPLRSAKTITMQVYPSSCVIKLPSVNHREPRQKKPHPHSKPPLALRNEDGEKAHYERGREEKGHSHHANAGAPPVKPACDASCQPVNQAHAEPKQNPLVFCRSNPLPSWLSYVPLTDSRLRPVPARPCAEVSLAARWRSAGG